mgnify:CR=1 FL=1
MTEGPDAADRVDDGSQQLEDGDALQEREADEQGVLTVEPKGEWAIHAPNGAQSSVLCACCRQLR